MSWQNTDKARSAFTDVPFTNFGSTAHFDTSYGICYVVLNANSLRETLKPFGFTTKQEICDEDNEFVFKIMKLDPRDRPIARSFWKMCGSGKIDQHRSTFGCQYGATEQNLKY